MKMPNEWHQQCLINTKRTLQEAQKEMSRIEANVKRLIEDVALYEFQINLALAQKRDGFDREKFGKAKQKN